MHNFGIDIHSTFYQVCLVDENGELTEFKVTTSDEDKAALVQRLAAAPGCTVAMEACTGAFHLYDLIRSGAPDAKVIVVDPMAMRQRFPKKGKKTDRVDARNLASLAQYGDTLGVWVPSKEIRRMRQLTDARCHTVEIANIEMNRIHSMLKENGLVWKGRSNALWTRKGMDWLRERMASWHPEQQLTCQQALDRLAIYQQQIDELGKQMSAWCHNSGIAELLSSIPGVGDVGAFTILSEMGDWQRFKTAKQLVAYAGLNPMVSQSGSRAALPGRISKRGKSRLRWICVQLALVSMKHCQNLGRFYERIRKKTRSAGKAKVATARKLLTLCWHILKSGRPYNHENIELTKRKSLRRAVICEKLNNQAAA